MDDPPLRRKRISFGGEAWHALHRLSLDGMRSMQELADEAFRDLLKKHHRPVALRDALRQSVRMHPANDRIALPGSNRRAPVQGRLD
jgi:hypothetical protein